MPTQVPLNRVLTDAHWRRVQSGSLSLSLDAQQRCVIRDAAGRSGIGCSPAQAFNDYDPALYELLREGE